jgi:hypothetical protein
MGKYQDVFKRYEKKYWVTPEQQKQLTRALERHMAPDQYGEYPISSLYYDTADYRLIRTSLEKPVYKEKFRVRSYGRVQCAEESVFLELKKKFKGVVYKRRIAMEYGRALEYLGNGIPEDSQILREITWFFSLYGGLQPKAMISYDRTALFGKEDEHLRVTFDRNIRFRDTELDLMEGDWGIPLAPDGRLLMEIKIPGTMPLWLSHALGELSIFPTSFSKYGTAYQKYIFPETGGIICA